ncbi:MAG: hypothetical protein AMXMBFR53_36560 [Gemmatimonadota bacterium]
MAVSRKKKDTPPVHAAPLRREPMTFRLREDLHPLVERKAILAGQTRTQWLEALVTAAIQNGEAA